ncbi:hypothetical protein EXN61_22010 [Agrobacterium tumefaciens]|uniref:Uncharacterized protein n=1 Tax=Agrobacterium tumefaciens TaxID=358 RepID=A0A546XS36_AGRTU|nr:hypothetical protein [Agrobacterium tumefaciens]TRB03534.1 hypothetical protein EXN61_22010 [Agrobacterium tumefaciens]
MTGRELVTDKQAIGALLDNCDFAADMIRELLASGVAGKGSLAGKLTEAQTRLEAAVALVRDRLPDLP